MTISAESRTIRRSYPFCGGLSRSMGSVRFLGTFQIWRSDLWLVPAPSISLSGCDVQDLSKQSADTAPKSGTALPCKLDSWTLHSLLAVGLLPFGFLGFPFGGSIQVRDPSFCFAHLCSRWILTVAFYWILGSFCPRAFWCVSLSDYQVPLTRLSPPCSRKVPSTLSRQFVIWPHAPDEEKYSKAPPIAP